MKDNPVIFKVDDGSDLPIWIQLRNRMTYLIRTGKLNPGDQIPSIRSLSAEAQINYGTVTRAYRDLELDGLIVSVRGRGMFVRDGIKSSEEPKVASTDAALEDCIHQYQILGMTFDEVVTHIEEVIARVEEKSRDSVKERIADYGTKE